MLVSRALHGVKAHLEHALLPEGSTFASGSEPSSSTQLSRVADRSGASPPSLRGKNQRELPSLYSEASGKKYVNEKCERNALQGLDNFQRSIQLRINASPERFRRVFDNEIRLDTLAFDTVSLPGIPAGDRHSQNVSPRAI